MPFKSKAQMRWMYANKPEMADRWIVETGSIESLPERTDDKNKTEKRKNNRYKSYIDKNY